MPQRKSSTDETVGDGNPDVLVERFLRGLDYSVVQIVHGDDSPQARSFLENHPSADGDLQYVREVLRRIIVPS